MSGFLWRLVFGVLVVRALRLAWRWAPALAVWGAGLALWPSVAVAWGLRRRGLPAARARWPRWARGAARAGPGHAGAGRGPRPAGASLAAALATLYLAGWVGPLALPLGVRAGAGGPAVLSAVSRCGSPGGSSWPACGPSRRPRWCGVILRRPAAGADGGRGPGNRKSEIALREAPSPASSGPSPPSASPRRPSARTTGRSSRCYGPGLLAMVVAPPGVGKTEIAYGSLAAAVDGLPSARCPPRSPGGCSS